MAEYTVWHKNEMMGAYGFHKIILDSFSSKDNDLGYAISVC